MPRYSKPSLRPSARMEVAAGRVRVQKKSSQGIKITPGVVVMVLVLILGGAYALWSLTREGKDFHPKGEVLTYTRDAANDSTPQVSVEDVFTEQREYSLRDGNGLTVYLMTKHDPKHGYGLGVDTFTVEPWHSLEETTNSERRAYIESRKADFQDHVVRFLIRTPRTWTFELYVDDTDGIDQTLQMQVRDAWNDLNIPGLIQKGDGVKLYFVRLSNTDFLNRKRVAVPQGAEGKLAEYQAKINEGLDWLLEPRGATKETSLATGLFNAAAEDGGDQNRTMLIFSDGLENMPFVRGHEDEATLSFYSDHAAIQDSAKWPRTDSLLTQYKKVPDLNGARIEWYGPQTGKNDLLIRAALRYWQHLLSEQGHADVHTHY